MRLTVLGLGLIGGSAAIDLRRRGFADEVIGLDRNPAHAAQARRLGLVDRVETDPGRAIEPADLVMLCVPVDAALAWLPQLLDVLRPDQVLTDFCSTKRRLAECVQGHPRRGRYVGAHPMAGTEKSGPQAAVAGLFEGKVAVLCDSESCDVDALARVDRMCAVLGMKRVCMDAQTHDERVACVSHLAHLCAFALSLTVQDREDRGRAMRQLAGGGFDSAVRLARSPASMWAPIFQSNRAPVLDALQQYQAQLRWLQDAIAGGDDAELVRLIDRANRLDDDA